MDKISSAAARNTQQQQQQQQQQDPANCSSASITATDSSSSIFVPGDAPVYDIPVSAINRPLQSVVDPDKVAQFAQEMAAGAQFTPIEVIHVQDQGSNYYYAFGGCHRWAAVKQLGLPTIRARLVKVPPATISTFLGASSPFRQQRQQQQPQQQQQQQQQEEVSAAQEAPQHVTLQERQDASAATAVLQLVK